MLFPSDFMIVLEKVPPHDFHKTIQHSPQKTFDHPNQKLCLSQLIET